MNVINLNPPAPGDELVRLTNGQGADELNVDGKSFRRDHRNAFHVPRRYVDRALLTVGGFVEQPISKQELLQDVASAIVLMPACVEKEALRAALVGLFETVDEPAA